MPRIRRSRAWPSVEQRPRAGGARCRQHDRRIEREAMALEIQATINQLLDVGNEQFRGRYLFAGSDSTTAPFEYYAISWPTWATTRRCATYANQGVLFDTNVPGQELFGAVSAEVQGIDLNPVLTSDTRLADLRGGRGITAGTLVISDGSPYQHRIPGGR